MIAPLGSGVRVFTLGIVFNIIAAASPKWVFMKTFTAGVQVTDHFQSVENSTLNACARSGGLAQDCKAFGFHPEGASCWLYDYVVPYTRYNGTAAPGTDYYWLLSPRCPTELGYALGAGTCFKAYDVIATTWGDAVSTCRQDDGHLLMADTAEKIALLRNFNMRFWLGASDEEMEGQWHWLNGEALSLQSPLWKSGEPDNFLDRQNYLSVGLGGQVEDNVSRRLRQSDSLPDPCLSLVPFSSDFIPVSQDGGKPYTQTQVYRLAF